MRKYTPKDNVQKQAYFSDRFFVSPSVPRFEIESDEIFSSDFEKISNVINIKEAYIEHTHLVLHIEKKNIVNTMKYLRDVLEYDMLIELSAIDYLALKDVYSFAGKYRTVNISKSGFMFPAARFLEESMKKI
jgi:NADH-quinone oxidoreductase subunit C